MDAAQDTAPRPTSYNELQAKLEAQRVLLLEYSAKLEAARVLIAGLRQMLNGVPDTQPEATLQPHYEGSES